MSTDHRIHLHVLLIQQPQGWVAQALQHDFAAQGDTQEKALRHLAYTIAAHVRVTGGDTVDSIAAVPPAPQPYWNVFERAALRHAQATELDAPGLPPAFVIRAIAETNVYVSR